MGVVEMMMQRGLGEILSEMSCGVGLKTKRESEGCGEVVLRMWEKKMKENNETGKRRLNELIVTLVEEDGEEDGMLDGIVGMMNNPLINDGFGSLAHMERT